MFHSQYIHIPNPVQLNNSKWPPVLSINIKQINIVLFNNLTLKKSQCMIVNLCIVVKFSESDLILLDFSLQFSLNFNIIPRSSWYVQVYLSKSLTERTATMLMLVYRGAKMFSWLTVSSTVIDGTSFWRTLQRRDSFISSLCSEEWNHCDYMCSNLLIWDLLVLWSYYWCLYHCSSVPSKPTVPSPLSSASFTMVSISLWLMCSPISLVMANRSSSVVISPSPSMSNYPETQEKKKVSALFISMTPQRMSWGLCGKKSGIEEAA